MGEGLVEAADSNNANGGPASASAAAAAAVTGPTSADGGSRNEEAAAEGEAPASATATLPPGEDRWTMNDGAADLAERGVELEMGGAGLPPSSTPFLLGRGGGRRRGRKRNRQEDWTEEAETEVSASLGAVYLVVSSRCHHGVAAARSALPAHWPRAFPLS